VLPFFHLYRGSQGKVAEFSASVSKIQRLRRGARPRSLPPHVLGPARSSQGAGAPDLRTGASHVAAFMCSVGPLPKHMVCDYGRSACTSSLPVRTPGAASCSRAVSARPRRDALALHNGPRCPLGTEALRGADMHDVFPDVEPHLRPEQVWLPMEASSPLLAVVEHWVDGNVLNLGLLACWRHVCPTSACTCGAAFVLIEFLSRVCSCRRRPSTMAQ